MYCKMGLSKIGDISFGWDLLARRNPALKHVEMTIFMKILSLYIKWELIEDIILFCIVHYFEDKKNNRKFIIR